MHDDGERKSVKQEARGGQKPCGRDEQKMKRASGR
jgi:hypothetical protein